MRKEAILNAIDNKIQKKAQEKEKIQVPIIIDRDRNLNYETHNWAMKILRVPIMLILNMLPKKLGKLLFVITGNNNVGTKAVYNYATTYKALEIIYTYPERRRKKEVNFTDILWGEFLNNSLAIRNRLLLVKRELLTAIKEAGQRKNEVCLLGLGSGSARAVFETIAMINGNPPVKIKLIDISREAINYSKELASTFNVDQTEWHRDYAQNLENYCENFHPDIVEMVGLLDYYPREQAIDLIAKIYKSLSPNGWLITCNIRPNLESPFVSKSINWPLIYRNPRELTEIIIKGGFSPEYLKVIYEPLRIHGLIIAQKIF